MAGVIVRPAVLRDLDSLVGLLRDLFAVEEDFEFDEPRQRKGLIMMLDHDSAVVLVAESEGRVVGISTGQSTISTAEGGFALLVEDVVVAEKWQGQGVGRKLMAALEQWAGERKIERLQLLADRSNMNGMGFYKALDWQSTALVCLRKRLPVCSSRGGNTMLAKESRTAAKLVGFGDIKSRPIGGWQVFLREGNQFLATAAKAHAGGRQAFTTEILYNLVAMAIEKLIMALLMESGNLPYNHTMHDLVESMEEFLPGCLDDLGEELKSLDRYQEICDKENYVIKTPTLAEVSRMLELARKVQVLAMKQHAD